MICFDFFFFLLVKKGSEGRTTPAWVRLSRQNEFIVFVSPSSVAFICTSHSELSPTPAERVLCVISATLGPFFNSVQWPTLRNEEIEMHLPASFEVFGHLTYRNIGQHVWAIYF